MSNRAYIDQQIKRANQIRDSQTEDALALCLSTEQLAQQINYQTGIASSLKTAAYCQTSIGDISEALINANKSFCIYQELNDTVGMSEVTNELGRIYWSLGDYPNALQCIINMVEYARQLKDPRREAMARNNLSILYADQNLFDESLREVQKAIQIYRENADKLEEHRSINNLATIYYDLEELDDALHQAFIALKFFEAPHPDLLDSSLEAEKAEVLNTIGRIYVKKRNEQLALDFFNRSLASSLKIKDIRNQQRALADIGRIHLNSGETGEALHFLKQAIDLAEITESKKELFECYLALSETYELMGDHESALIYFKRYFEENKAVFGEEQHQKLQQLEIKFKTKSIQRESELLTEKNEALQNLADELDNEVNRKTAELRTALENEVSLKDTLALALNKEKELNRLKSNIINTINHEFRTPLNAIIGYSEMLTDEMEDDNYGASYYLEDVNRIEKAGRHMLQLINEVLDLSKLEENNLNIDLNPIDIDSMLKDVIELVKPELEKQHNQFLLNNHLHHSKITSDQVKLKQILINLLNNATKFTENGIIELTISENDLHQIFFSIKDSGIGIAEENFDHIFESFYQVENSLSRNYQGTGLGLAISQKFATLLSGDITVQSTLGKGSTFTLVLPKLTS